MNGSRPEYQVALLEDVYIPMRDGVKLAVDIYRPALDGEPAPGRFPAVLERTSYDKSRPFSAGTARYLCRRGYVGVVQDLRGRYKSEGKGQYYHVYNVHEGEDGYDAIEWIAGQPWCTGKVGTIGSSHGGIVQSALAVEDPPHLAAMFISQSASNPYTAGMRHNGAFELRMTGGILLHAITSQEADGDAVARRALEENMLHLKDWLKRLPWKPGFSPLAPVPNLEKILLEFYTRGDYDAFWKHPCINYEEHYDRYADVPTHYETGWYDSWTRPTAENYVRLAQMKRGPLKLTIGSGTHGWHYTGATHSGDADFGKDAPYDYRAEALRWFDRWLKGVENGIESEPKVRIFVMGGGDGRKNAQGRLNVGGRWRAEQEWPLARAQYTPYYFHTAGGLDTRTPGPADAPRAYTFDPDHPTPTIGGNMSGYLYLAPQVKDAPDAIEAPIGLRYRSVAIAGAFDQKEEPGIFACEPPYLPLSSRPDVLVFQTEPLTSAIEVTGPLQVELWVSSSAPDTDFTAKLVDVYPANADYPHGYAMNLSDSIMRARYRNGWEHGAMLEAGAIYRITFELYPVSVQFAAGHRIRIDISSSNFPRFDVNPNTGEPMGRHTHTMRAQNILYMDQAHPSHIVLPLIPME